MEPRPLGTAGAVKYAQQYLDSTVIVFNGDVLTQIDLSAVLRLHRKREARATIVLTPVDNPSAYGVVETDSSSNVRRFLEKPTPDESSCKTINAGIYVIEPDTLDRIPKDTPWSIERSFFPSLVEREERFVAYVSHGYWIDIGTPIKYQQVHRDIMDGRFPTAPFGDRSAASTVVAASATIADDVTLEGPCFVDEGVVIETGSHIGPYTVLGRECTIREGARLDGAIVWPYTDIEREARLRDAILGRRCHVGRHAWLGAGTILGDGSIVTDYSRTLA